MSFSTASLAATDVKTSDRFHGLAGAFHIYPWSIEQFLDDLVPCSAPFARDDDLSTAFAEHNPIDGDEKPGYLGMLAGLNAIVGLSGERRLHFYQTHGKEMQFPFKDFIHCHEGTYPDILVSFPAASLVELADVTWNDLSLIMELKPTAEEDPFDRDGVKHSHRVIQMSRNARNLLLANGALATFAVGIYGQTVRLVHFDHSGAIVAPPFYLKAESLQLQPDGHPLPSLASRPQLLQRFFWHFTHPIRGDTVVGCDPSSRTLTHDDRLWVAEQLAKANVENVKEQLTELHKGRRVEVPSLVPGSPPRNYITYCPLDINGHLFSRATNVWRAIEDTRIIDSHGKLVDDPARIPKPQILKEAWRQLDRNSELSFYERLTATIPENERVGLPRLVCGGDLGVAEVREWARSSPKVSIMDGERDLRLPGAVIESGTPEASQTFNSGLFTGNPEPFPFPFPQHQTFSSAIGMGKDHTCRERSHMRFVIDDVGRPLTKFTCAKQMVAAMRDSIIGHKLAWENAGVLHRDVSVGNILIVDEESERHRGFLHDFDYSSMTDDTHTDDLSLEYDSEDMFEDGLESAAAELIGDRRKERTGTYYFMAFEILERCVVHRVHHDLESFYWVLVYVTLRHTFNTITVEQGRMLFIHGNDDQAAGNKLHWIISKYRSLRIPGNTPLVKLVRNFTSLIVQAIGFQTRPASEVLTHNAVLKIFDDALAMEGWPESDFIASKWLDTNSQAAAKGIMSDVGAGNSILAPREPEPAPPPTGYRLRSSAKRSRGAVSANPATEADLSGQPSLKRQRIGSEALT